MPEPLDLLVVDNHGIVSIMDTEELCSCSTVDSSNNQSEGDTCSVISVIMPGPLIQGDHLLTVLFKQHSEEISDFMSQNFRVIIDSGASAHMLPHRRFFRNIDASIKGSVSLGDISKKLQIVGAGHTTMPILGLTLLSLA